MELEYPWKTAFDVLMKNSVEAFGSVENKMRKRLFADKKINEEAEKTLKQTESNDNILLPSPQSTSEMDIEGEMIDDSSCSDQNDNDMEMQELQTRFSQTLGKRFSAAQQDICENMQESRIKRRKENEGKQLEEEAESSKEERGKENETMFRDGVAGDDYFYKFKYSLVTVQKPSILTAGFACIEKGILKELLESMEPQEFIAKYALIDCRYPYEYEGGHIKGALNIYDPAVLENTFFPECPATFQIINRKIPIFYCEYSSARGPMLASHLRKSDRVRNFTKYPSLYYNEIYVLEGGYSSFYNTKSECFKDLCEPTGYVSMHDKRYSNALKLFRKHNLRNAVGFETGMFQTALIKKKNDMRRVHSVPQMPESPTASEFSSARSPKSFILKLLQYQCLLIHVHQPDAKAIVEF
ncbi:Rhodanese-like protein [Dirofilaria immitis]|nr:Rhodanese-like protein [Dirofilaria immitis]